MPLYPWRPLKIDEITPERIAIEWSDGHRSVYDYRNLRFQCQCALCRDEHTGRELIRLENIAADVHPVRIDPVGNYALRFNWSDGHMTGLYSYDLLRALCECPLCNPGKQ